MEWYLEGGERRGYEVGGFGRELEGGEDGNGWVGEVRGRVG